MNVLSRSESQSRSFEIGWQLPHLSDAEVRGLDEAAKKQWKQCQSAVCRSCPVN